MLAPLKDTGECQFQVQQRPLSLKYTHDPENAHGDVQMRRHKKSRRANFRCTSTAADLGNVGIVLLLTLVTALNVSAVRLKNHPSIQ